MTMLRDAGQTAWRSEAVRRRQHPPLDNFSALAKPGRDEPAHRRIRRGETLFRAGDLFRSLYLVQLGFFKSFLSSEDGRSQVTGFQMPGDLLGMDGIGIAEHTQTAVALDDSAVLVFPYAEFESPSTHANALQGPLHRVMSQELARTHGMMILLGTMHAEGRVAAFLLDLSQRYVVRGYSGCEFTLRMTREDLASYLGLKLETVSRIVSRFKVNGLIEAHNRDVRILDKVKLSELAGRTTTA